MAGTMTEAAFRGSLPPHLRERTRLAPGASAAQTGVIEGMHVLYWMRGLAMRAHENPALDCAVFAANRWGLPLLILLHVEDRYPHATARRQMFLLEGAREAQGALVKRFHPEDAKVDIIVHVDRKETSRGSDLLEELAKTAALVVTEEPFCNPWLAGVERLQAAGIRSPLWLVDCSSIVPNPLVSPSNVQRAYAYENATKRLHADRIPLVWDELPLSNGVSTQTRGAAPLSEFLEHLRETKLLDRLELEAMSEADLLELVASMDVDQAVRPVAHTSGGSSQGYARWLDFLEKGGLQTYAQRRNEALDVHGVSRMSAYLNTGMVSPMRIAREAHKGRGAGKVKFLNEFLTWRGVCYAWCYHYPMPSSGCTLRQLPSWAQHTLTQHAVDPRPALPQKKPELSMGEALLQGETGDRAWDGMQRYLIHTGELHNNARMGWAGAVVRWSASPDEAMSALIRLNDTFALDGHSPCSYGGLLGSMGLFGSQAKGKEAPVVGKVAACWPKPKYATLPANIASLLGGSASSERLATSGPPSASDRHTPGGHPTKLTQMWRPVEPRPAWASHASASAGAIAAKPSAPQADRCAESDSRLASAPQAASPTPKKIKRWKRALSNGAMVDLTERSEAFGA